MFGLFLFERAVSTYVRSKMQKEPEFLCSRSEIQSCLMFPNFKITGIINSPVGSLGLFRLLSLWL